MHGVPWHGQPGAAWYQHNVAWHGTAWLSSCSIALASQHSTASMMQPSIAWLASCSTRWCRTEWEVQCGMVQPAQYGTGMDAAQCGAAQHNMVQHHCCGV